MLDRLNRLDTFLLMPHSMKFGTYFRLFVLLFMIIYFVLLTAKIGTFEHFH